MERPKAFSLRDLVLLLCLVALGLPILAASLPGTISRSAAERCRTTLASLTRCVLVYTEQNRGYMPVYVHKMYEGSEGPLPQGPTQPDRSAVAFSSGGSPPRDPNTGLYTDTRNLGLLYARGLAKPPELFYCPAPIRDTRHMLSNYPKPWGSKIGPGSSFIRVGYMWNPWVKPVPGGSLDQWTYEDGLVLRKHPADWPLVCDLAMSMNHTAHVEGNSALWNLAYPNGHVVAMPNQPLYDVFASGLDAKMEWSVFNQYVLPWILPRPTP